MDISSVKVSKNNEATKSHSTDTILHCPPISKELLRYLRSVFQDNVPTEAMTDRKIWIEVGKIDVVRHLEGIYKMQNELEN